MEYTNKSGNKCSAAQFIAELVCTRKSKKQNIPMIDKFWNQPEWKQYYQRQISLAHGLLKLFDAESIITALNSKDGNWIFSLGTKSLVDTIKLIQDKNEKQEKLEIYEESKEIKFEEQAIKEIAQIRAKKNSLLDKLKDLE